LRSAGLVLTKLEIAKNSPTRLPRFILEGNRGESKKMPSVERFDMIFFFFFSFRVFKRNLHARTRHCACFAGFAQAAASLTIISVGYIINVSRILTISSRVAKSSTVDDCDSWDLHCLVLLHILLAISRGALLIFGRTSALISIYTTSTARDDNSASLQFP